MNLDKKNLRWVFLITLTLTLMVPALTPSWKLFFFAPFLIISFYQRPYITCLWYSFSCGLILDLFLSQERFGLYALNFTLTTAALFSQKRNFFADSLTTLPIMTFLFSTLSTIIHTVLMHGLEGGLSLSWGWISTDLIVMPLIDALYAFTLFILPFFFFGKRPRKGGDYFIEA